MADINQGVVYTGPGQVEVQDLDYPKLELREQNNRQLQHGVILKVVATNICGSDQHMVRGRTTAPAGLSLGHEITGEVVELGRDVEFLNQGDIVSVPFNIACGRCRNCKERNTGVCENVNPARAGAAYGYVDMGGWLGGQARYVTVPYADWNLLKFPDRDQAMAKIRDLAMLSDIFPTGYHGAFTAGVTTGSTVYVAGAGPVGLACATSCHLLGAAVVIVGDLNAERLAQAASFGCETINLSETDDVRGAIEQLLGVPEVDAAVDCVGFEARGHGAEGSQGEAPATVLNTIMDITRSAGKLGIPGLYVTGDPGAVDEPAKVGSLSIRIGLGWAKSHSFTTGQCPVMKYNRQLMMAILHDKVQIARNVNATVIPLDQAPQGYQDFDQGAEAQPDHGAGVRATSPRQAARDHPGGHVGQPGERRLVGLERLAGRLGHVPAVQPRLVEAELCQGPHRHRADHPGHPCPPALAVQRGKLPAERVASRLPGRQARLGRLAGVGGDMRRGPVVQGHAVVSRSRWAAALSGGQGGPVALGQVGDDVPDGPGRGGGHDPVPRAGREPGEQAPDPQVRGLQALGQARGRQLDRSSSRIVSENSPQTTARMPSEMAGLNQEPRPVAQPTSASTTAPAANAAAAIRTRVRPGGVLMGFSLCSSPQPGESPTPPGVTGVVTVPLRARDRRPTHLASLRAATTRPYRTGPGPPVG